MPRKCVRPGSRSASECADRTAIEIATEEVFGNCPKYIQARPPEDDGAQTRAGFVRVLDERRLRVPDYAGNNMFQTLGNITLGWRFVEYSPFNPR